MDLSKRRALSVKRWLMENGVGAERLIAVGCGETRPIADNRRSKGRQTNRRVEFHIMESDAKDTAIPEGCEASE